MSLERTDELRLYAFTCGWLTGARGGFLEGESGSIRVPVPVYLIEHPRGRVLFDTGLHRDTAHDPAGRLGPIADFFEIELEADAPLAERLAGLSIDPERIDWMVNSHLHFDHVGGNADLPNARMVLQRCEWEAGVDPDRARANAFDPADYDLGHDRLLVDGEHDLFGDGRVVCIPTYGHTPGHQSLRVRLDGGTEVVLAADACYLRQSLEALHLPAVLHDREASLAALRRLRELQRAGARLFYGHDPEFWRGVAQAPQPIDERSLP